jgi:tRNA (guanine-N7-)-methyltransferase
MPRKKLKRRYLATKISCIIEESKQLWSCCSGNWSTEFANQNFIVLELACGRGEYTNFLAKAFPSVNFIGIDMKAERLWQAANENDKSLLNVRFLKANINCLEKFFGLDEIAEIFIIQPDPYTKNKSHKFLTVEFFKKIISISKSTFSIHLQTDSQLVLDEFKKICLILNLKIVRKDKVFYSKILSANVREMEIMSNFKNKALIKGNSVFYITAIC